MAAAGGLLFVGLEQGVILALDTENGKEVWRYTLPDGRVGRVLVYGNEHLLVASETTRPFTNSHNALLALDNQGQVAWQFDVPAHSLSVPAVLGNRLFFTASNGMGYMLEAKSGVLDWQTPDLHLWTPAPPVAGDNLFYVAAGAVGSGAVVVKAIELAGWGTTDLFRLEGMDSRLLVSLAYGRKVVYVAWANKHLCAIDTMTGQLRWQATIGPSLTSPLTVGQHLYIGAKEQGKGGPSYTLYALDLADGRVQWRFPTGRSIVAPVLVADDLVLVGSQDGRLYALDTQDGTACWLLEVRGEIMTAPLISGNKLFFGTRAGRIVAASWQEKEAAAEPFLPPAQPPLEADDVTEAGPEASPVIFQAAVQPDVAGLPSTNRITAAQRRLRQQIEHHFSQEELKTLCTDLGVDFDSLPGEGKAGKARELISYLSRRGQLPELLRLCQEERPQLSWTID